MIVLLVEQGDGSYEADFVGNIYRPKAKDEVDDLIKNIRHSGYYPYITTKTEMEELNASKERVDALFTRLMGQTREGWVKIAEERLSSKGVRCFTTPGNDDRFIVDDVLRKSKFVENPEGKVVEVDRDNEMISSGWSSPTPWNSPRETSEEELEKRIEEMATKVRNMQNCIFNTHVPPIDTPLDPAPKLDKNLGAVTAGGQLVMISAGSKAVRNAIVRHQPLLGLHGHIHESKAFCSIGRTLCLNPGSEYGEGILRSILMKLSKKGLNTYVFTQG